METQAKKAVANKGVVVPTTSAIMVSNNAVVPTDTIAQEYQTQEKPSGIMLKVVKATDKLEGMNDNKRPMFEVKDGILTVERATDTVQIEFSEEIQQMDDYEFSRVSFEQDTYGLLYQQYTEYPSVFLFGSRTMADSPQAIADAFGIPLEYASSIYSDYFTPTVSFFRELSKEDKGEDSFPREALRIIKELKEKGFAERNIRAMFSFQKGRFDGAFRAQAKALPTKIFIISLASIPDKDIQITFSFEKDSDRKAVHELYKNGQALFDAYLANKADYPKLSLYADYIADKHNGEAETKFIPKTVIQSDADESSIM